MNDIKLCGIVICCIVVVSIFKGIKSEYTLFLRIIITILISSLSFVLFIPILEYIDETQFYVYTFYRSGHKDGERITVYRTLFKENNDPNVDKDGDGRMDEWIAYSSHSGTAVAKILLGSQFTIINTTWQIGTSVKK